MRNRETTAEVVNQRARELRTHGTGGKILRQHLRAKQMDGLRFRRQECCMAFGRAKNGAWKTMKSAPF